VIVCVLKVCRSPTATGVFTPSSISRDAAALWDQIPEPVQAVYTKEYFDDYVNNMIKYSTLGVSLDQKLLNDRPISKQLHFFRAKFGYFNSHICLWYKNISLDI
jgi:hypothetical protein